MVESIFCCVVFVLQVIFIVCSEDLGWEGVVVAGVFVLQVIFIVCSEDLGWEGVFVCLFVYKYKHFVYYHIYAVSVVVEEYVVVGCFVICPT